MWAVPSSQGAFVRFAVGSLRQVWTLSAPPIMSRLQPSLMELGTSANPLADYCLVYNYYSATPPSNCSLPGATGVYWLRNKEGKVLFVGKGNVRERLLSHWNRENSTDAKIWSHNPTTFRFELATRPSDRHAELVCELKPLCHPAPPSFFSWR
jgi:hypothetical protein